MFHAHRDPVCRMAAFAAAAAAILWPVQGSAEVWRWVQFVPGGAEVRAATDEPECPGLEIDGAPAAMTVRAPASDAFPVLICAKPLPAGAKHASIGDVPLPLPRPAPNRIVIVGDTGCRLKEKQQDCNDIVAWPFKLGATIGATFKPDLVLHVGDFHYRETACATGKNGCAGSPFGDTWDVWREDFFAPASSLLQAAPWIMVRGNHEVCDRGGHGWARALDPYPFDPATGNAGCLPAAKPYTVDIGGVTIEVMDVASAGEVKADEAQLPLYREMFAFANTIEGPVWQTFHRPVWASNGNTDKAKQVDNKTLAAAAEGNIPANVQAFISGHIHTFQVMEYDGDLPLQIVSGHGGDDLAMKAPEVVKGLTINGVTVKEGMAKPGVFGFSILERTPGDGPADTGGTWTLTGYDTFARPFGVCTIIGRAVDCH